MLFLRWKKIERNMATKTVTKKIDWTKPADQKPDITISDFKNMVKESEKSTIFIFNSCET